MSDQKPAVVARALGRSGEPAAPNAGSLPVILAEEDFEPWLRNEASLQLLKLAPENPPPRWPVSQRVNSSKAPVDDPTLIEQIAIYSAEYTLGRVTTAQACRLWVKTDIAQTSSLGRN